MNLGYSTNFPGQKMIILHQINKKKRQNSLDFFTVTLKIIIPQLFRLDIKFGL